MMGQIRVEMTPNLKRLQGGCMVAFGVRQRGLGGSEVVLQRRHGGQMRRGELGDGGSGLLRTRRGLSNEGWG